MWRRIKSPIIQWTISPTPLVATQPCTLDSSASYARQGASLVGGSLDWGDGTLDVWMGDPIPRTHVYVSPGSYTIALSVQDSRGVSSKLTASLTVTPPTPIPPPVTPPAAPTGLAATPGNQQVSLIWNGSSGATSYRVERATASGGPYTLIATPTATVYQDTGLTNGTTYFYIVKAVNSAGSSPASSQVSATPSGGAAPDPPVNLVAVAGDTLVNLSWNASAGATSYTVARATVSGGPYTTVASGLTGLTYQNTGLTNGTTYFYVVRAVNANGSSANSTQVSATPQASTGPTFYVKKTGSNSNPGTLAQPFLTINKGVSVLTAGATLIILDSEVYAESLINNIPSGTSWTNKVTIKAAVGQTPIMRPASGTFVIYLAGTSKYIEFSTLVIDGLNVTANAVKLESFNASNDPHHIRFIDCEVLGSPTGEGSLFLVVGILPGAIGFNEFIRCIAHRAPSTAFGQGALGFYIQTSNNLIDGCEVYDTIFGGLQIYNGYGNQANNNVVRNCSFHSPRRVAGRPHVALLVYTTNSGTLVYNNLIYDWPSDGANTKGVEYGSGAANVGFYNNTIQGVGGTGLDIHGTGNIVRNTVAYQCSPNFTNAGSGTVQSTNSFASVNPLFVNAGAGDFHLQAGSPLINAGTTVSAVPTDKDGVTRPQGSAYDIGAYERA